MRRMRSISGVALLVFAACAGQDETADTAATQPDTGAAAQTPPAGGAPATTPSAGTAQAAGGACSYITEADVTQIMGQPMKFGETAEQGECLLVSSAGDQTVSVSFQVQSSTVVFDQMATASGMEQVSGIGEKAVVAQTGASSTVAAVKGGRGYLGAVYNMNQQSASKQQAVEVARKVVARM